MKIVQRSLSAVEQLFQMSVVEQKARSENVVKKFKVTENGTDRKVQETKTQL